MGICFPENYWKKGINLSGFITRLPEILQLVFGFCLVSVHRNYQALATFDFGLNHGKTDLFPEAATKFTLMQSRPLCGGAINSNSKDVFDEVWNDGGVAVTVHDKMQGDHFLRSTNPSSD